MKSSRPSRFDRVKEIRSSRDRTIQSPLGGEAGGGILEREREYHDRLYSGPAQAHFAKPAVRALRRDLVGRVLALSGAGPQSRVLSLGCGIGDTELLLAPHVGEVVGTDISRAGVEQARANAARLGIGKARFEVGTTAQGRFDLVLALFFLHHLGDSELAGLPPKVRDWLAPGGVFYSLDPNRSRLSGALGRLLVPGQMKRYQSPEERELDPEVAASLFRKAGLQVRMGWYDFWSVPLSGLFPAWGWGYRMARALDDLLLRVRPISRWGSDFELMAWKDEATWQAIAP